MVTKKHVLRLINLAMLAAAVLFVGCALSAPNLGRTIYIGIFEFGVKQWRDSYALYVLVMTGLFAASFVLKYRRR